MKFSQVFVVVSVLFAISFALPSNWEENDEVLLASNDKAVQEKRVLPALILLIKKAALGAAIRAACNWGSLPDKVKGVCNCGSLAAGDEESEVDERRRLFSQSALSELKSKVKSICNNKYVKLALSGLCGCIQPFL